MEDADVLPPTSIESYTTTGFISFDRVHTQRIWEFDLQRPNFLWWNYFPPPYNQLAHYSVVPDPRWEQCYWPLATGPTVLSPWHISDAGVQVTLTPGVSGGNPGDEFGGIIGFANGLRPGRVPFTCQEDSFQGTNLPFNPGNGNDVQLCNPNLFGTTSDGQSPDVSPQQLEFIPGTHPNPPSEHHPDQSVEAPEPSGVQKFPETETAQGSRIRLFDSKEWPCDRDGCNKSYKRPQDVKRHVREKHGTLPECIICGVEWTRAEKIRRHLIKEHLDHFTKKELQQIRHLHTLNNTINFLNEWEATRP